MKFYSTYAAVLCCIAAQPILAGSMGAAQTGHLFTPFVSAEGAATWSTTHNVDFQAISLAHGIQIPKNYNPWGGRVAGGIAYQYRPNVALTAETAWNYFGDVSYTGDNIFNFSTKGSLYGADVLIGASYLYKNIEWFLKAGTLFQTIQYQASTPNAQIALAGTTIVIDGSYKGMLTAALPEIKVGGIYDFNEHWGLSLAYMHVFGQNPSANVTIINDDIATGTPAHISGAINKQNPTLNSVLLGLRYNFV